jgi:hypothetical protein
VRKIALLLFVAAAMMAPLSASGGQTNGPKSVVLGQFHIVALSPAFRNGQIEAGIPLLNNGVEYNYKIPRKGVTVKVILYLPKGAVVTRSIVNPGPAAIVKARKDKPGYSDLHPKLLKDSKGIFRPTWVFHHLEQPGYPVWKFTVKVPGQATQLCMTAIGQIYNLAGAPVQKAGPVCIQKKGSV